MMERRYLFKRYFVNNMTCTITGGAVAAPGKPIRLQRKATVGEEGLLLPENQNQRGEVSSFILNMLITTPLALTS